MYAIPITVIVVVALIAVAWSPLFALIVFVPAFLAFLAYVGMTRRADQKIRTPQVPATGPSHEDDTDTGLWGEERP
jgi:Flp pilus assembly protein TadB